MKTNPELKSDTKKETAIELMEQYISRIGIDPEDKINKELLSELKKELEAIIKS